MYVCSMEGMDTAVIGFLDIPKGPCAQIVCVYTYTYIYIYIYYTLGPMYLYGEYFKANLYTIWAHGLLGHSHFSAKTTRALHRGSWTLKLAPPCGFELALPGV